MTRRDRCRGAVLDIAATLALAAGLGLLALLARDMLAGPSPARIEVLVRGALLLSLFGLPILLSAIAWPVHLWQRRRGHRVFPGLLRGIVFASTLWMALVFQAILAL